MAEPRAVSALRLGQVHPSARCLATPALNSESDDFAAPPETEDLGVVESRHIFWMRGQRFIQVYSSKIAF